MVESSVCHNRSVNKKINSKDHRIPPFEKTVSAETTHCVVKHLLTVHRTIDRPVYKKYLTQIPLKNQCHAGSMTQNDRHHIGSWTQDDGTHFYATHLHNIERFVLYQTGVGLL